MEEKKDTIRVIISKTLYDEIKYAQNNLNRLEKEKKGGIKKKKYSFQESSYKVGKFLFSQRKTKKNDF